MEKIKQIIKGILPYSFVQKYYEKKYFSDENCTEYIDWKRKKIEFNRSIISLNTIEKYIEKYKHLYQKDKTKYYNTHSVRYLMSISYIIENDLYKGTILEVGDGIDFFSFLLKEILGLENILHVNSDLRRPLDLAKDSIDVVICMEIFEHIIDTDMFDKFGFKGIITMMH